MMFGMVLEGLPAAVVLIPVVFPIAEKMGIDPIHFNIVQTASVGIGLFLPPMGVGLLMALKFANLTVGQHWRTYMPYVAALMIGLMLIILFPQLSLFLPKRGADLYQVDLGHREPMVLAVARRPGDRLAGAEADQRRADRRHHRDAMLVEALVDRIDQLQGARVAVVGLEGHGRAHAHDVRRHLVVDDLARSISSSSSCATSGRRSIDALARSVSRS